MEVAGACLFILDFVLGAMLLVRSATAIVTARGRSLDADAILDWRDTRDAQFLGSRLLSRRSIDRSGQFLQSVTDLSRCVSPSDSGSHTEHGDSGRTDCLPGENPQESKT